uniref:Fibrinogen C-terminal domain-containing protein n=1 Tax=Anopheles atroparvus TaxID=41427 RepID=A0AAG5DCA0_ANOAO
MWNRGCFTKLDKLGNKLNRIVPYSSCMDVPTTVSGTYGLQVGPQRARLSVYCEQIAFGGGWVVFQHRFNGSVDFYRTWDEYREGFGSLDGEFWLGLDYLHRLTSARPHELIVEVRNFFGDYGYAHYDQFTIESESEQYSLQLGKYNGTAGDSMIAHTNMKFTTKDRDNDLNSFGNCAEYYQGAWWYDYCSHANLNGIYQNTTDSWNAMIWYFLKHDSRAMAYSRMMIRELK